MTETQGIDPTSVTPEEFAQLVANADDDQILEAFRAVGTEQVLNRVFEGMEERFVPEKAQGVDAQIQWVVIDDGTEHTYLTSIKDGGCKISKETADQPKVALKTDVVSFAKLITGKAQGPQLFMSGKLKVSGDIMFSQRITGFFAAPSAQS